MDTVVLVGTDHTYQRYLRGPNLPRIEEFRTVIRSLCVEHSVKAIAEEMNEIGLRDYDADESVAQQLCLELNIRHQFSDPIPKERQRLGIGMQENDIRLKYWGSSATPEEIEVDVQTYVTNAHQIREQYWLGKILELDVWPLLFICGAEHFYSFDMLLQENGLSVIHAYEDWKPPTQ